MADKKPTFDDALFTFVGSAPEWESVFDADGFKAWRRPHAGSALYEYRTVGVISEVPPKQYYKFYLDSLAWKTWDTNMEMVEIINKESEQVDWLYWGVKFPFPFSNRDYVYRRQATELGNETYLIHCKAAPQDSKPATSKRVRVVQYECTVAMKTAADGKSTQLFLDYFEDLQMSIPTTLMNWVTKTAVPEFIKKVSAQAKAYKQ